MSVCIGREMMASMADTPLVCLFAAVYDEVLHRKECFSRPDTYFPILNFSHKPPVAIELLERILRLILCIPSGRK